MGSTNKAEKNLNLKLAQMRFLLDLMNEDDFDLTTEGLGRLQWSEKKVKAALGDGKEEKGYLNVLGKDGKLNVSEENRRLIKLDSKSAFVLLKRILGGDSKGKGGVPGGLFSLCGVDFSEYVKTGKTWLSDSNNNAKNMMEQLIIHAEIPEYHEPVKQFYDLMSILQKVIENKESTLMDKENMATVMKKVFIATRKGTESLDQIERYQKDAEKIFESFQDKAIHSKLEKALETGAGRVIQSDQEKAPVLTGKALKAALKKDRGFLKDANKEKNVKQIQAANKDLFTFARGVGMYSSKIGWSSIREGLKGTGFCNDERKLDVVANQFIAQLKKQLQIEANANPKSKAAIALKKLKVKSRLIRNKKSKFQTQKNKQSSGATDHLPEHGLVSQAKKATEASSGMRDLRKTAVNSLIQEKTEGQLQVNRPDNGPEPLYAKLGQSSKQSGTYDRISARILGKKSDQNNGYKILYPQKETIENKDYVSPEEINSVNIIRGSSEYSHLISGSDPLYEEIDNIDDFECQCDLCTSQDNELRGGVKDRFFPNPQTPFLTARTIGRRIRRDRNETQLFDVN